MPCSRNISSWPRITRSNPRRSFASSRTRRNAGAWPWQAAPACSAITPGRRPCGGWTASLSARSPPMASRQDSPSSRPMLSRAKPASDGSPAPRPRLLFLSPRYLFPADSGGKIRTVGILRGLLGGAFEVQLVSPMPERAAAVDKAQLGQICDHFTGWPAAARGTAFRWTRMRHLVSGLPVAVATDYARAGRRTVDAALGRRPDLIVVDFPHAAVLARGPFPCPSVLFTHNVEAEIFRRHAETARDPLRRAVWSSQAAKMARYERALLGRFDAVVAVAERDREYFRRAYGANNVSVIPTGVDLDYFSYSATPVLEPADPATVVF